MAERTGYEAVMSKMEKEGITLSTVALGQGADTAFRFIGKRGSGRYYYVDEFSA